MKNLQGYFLASDIDGTLVVNGQMNRQDIDAIHDFTDRGGLFAIATGRSIPSALPIALAAGVNCPIVVNNGCAIYDIGLDKLLMTRHLTDKAKQFTLCALERFPEMGAMVFLDRGMSILQHSKETDDLAEYEQLEDAAVLCDELMRAEWQKVLFAGRADLIDNHFIDYCDKNGSECGEFVRTSQVFYELLPDGVSKGSGFIRLAGLLKAEHSKVCAIGDFYNDREMISAAGIGAYVGGAPDELKADCDYVAKPFADGGVADFIRYITDLA